jgi:hypothetical protein
MRCEGAWSMNKAGSRQIRSDAVRRSEVIGDG